jgi:hypothetical protein
MVVRPKHVAAKEYITETTEMTLRRRKSHTLISYTQQDANTQGKNYTWRYVRENRTLYAGPAVTSRYEVTGTLWLTQDCMYEREAESELGVSTTRLRAPSHVLVSIVPTFFTAHSQAPLATCYQPPTATLKALVLCVGSIPSATWQRSPAEDRRRFGSFRCYESTQKRKYVSPQRPSSSCLHQQRSQEGMVLKATPEIASISASNQPTN